MASALVSSGPYLKNTKAVTANTAIGNPTSGQTYVVAQGMTTGKVVIEAIDFAAVTDTVHNWMTYYLYDGTNAEIIASPVDIPEWTTRYTAFPVVKPYAAPVPLGGRKSIDLPDDTWKVLATVFTTVPDGIEISARGKIYV